MRGSRQGLTRVTRAATSCLALAGAAAAFGWTASACAAAALPPELQALEQKAQTLHIVSERFMLSFAIEEPSGKQTTLTSIGTGRISPPEAQLVETVESKRLVVRVLGHDLYESVPGLARLDGGRPWVHVRESELSAQTGVNFAAAPQNLTESFSLINSAAEGVQEVGPATVDGQATTEFSASIDLAQLFSRFGAKLVQKLQSVGVRNASLTLYLAPSGLPVRTSVAIPVEGGSITTTSDILATEVPVSVKAPPARETISESEFEKLRRKHPKSL
jgi:hypothetical protein